MPGSNHFVSLTPLSRSNRLAPPRSRSSRLIGVSRRAPRTRRRQLPLCDVPEQVRRQLPVRWTTLSKPLPGIAVDIDAEMGGDFLEARHMVDYGVKLLGTWNLLELSSVVEVEQAVEVARMPCELFGLALAQTWHDRLWESPVPSPRLHRLHTYTNVYIYIYIYTQQPEQPH